MSGTAIYVCSVVIYAGPPLLFAVCWPTLRFLLLYTHVAALNVVAALLGGVYVLDVAGTAVPAGQVAYAAILFTAVLLLLVGRDLQVLRHLVLLSVTVNVVTWVSFALTAQALDSDGIENLFGTAPMLFELSARPILVGTVLTVVELVGLLALLELSKSRLAAVPMTAVYLLGFTAALAFDGLFFPVLVPYPDLGVGELIVMGMQAKLLLALTYGLALAGFILLNRQTVARFESTPLPLRQLMMLSRDSLLERLRATEQRADRSAATVSGILDSARSTVLVTTDPDLRITRFNRGAELLMGWSESEVLGNTPAVFGPPGLPQHSARRSSSHRAEAVEFWRSLADGRYHDAAYLTKDRRAVVVSLSITEIRDGESLVGYLAVGEDVTERHRTQEAQAELVRRLEDADRVKDELVSTISHELRTPITSIQGYAELLADDAFGSLTTEQAEALEKVERNVLRLRALVDDLLFVARRQSAEDRLVLVPLDLREPVSTAWSTLAQIAKQRDLALLCDLPSEPVPVLGDTLVLERLVFNLAGNAVKFTPDGGTVRLSLAPSEVGVLLSVADDGIGIPPEDLPRVFDRFFRSVEANSRQIAGSGLGLHVAERIVTGHGGTIDVDSAPGQGTTVRVWLPLRRPEPSETG